ncbi:unnamed protein product [Cladocopium goreaui]|uniref:Uncharacterized protein n=1 Tax=Cladocopium goreaui TaxID=2562237 RepID=A0A9P1DMU7_9DINO|nr:unnamed protein product [Cladocopium goreaui]
MAVEGENAETDPQEEEAFLDVLEGEDAKGPMVKASFKVQVGNLAVALCFLPDQQDTELFSDPEKTQPQPRLLPIDARPMQRPEHQGQLCLGGLSFSLDKKLTEPEEEPFWNFSARLLSGMITWVNFGSAALLTALECTCISTKRMERLKRKRRPRFRPRLPATVPARRERCQ